jgi:hypothetical protein
LQRGAFDEMITELIANGILPLTEDKPFAAASDLSR